MSTVYPPGSVVPKGDRLTLWDLRGRRKAPDVRWSPRCNNFTASQRARALWHIRLPAYWTETKRRQLDPKKPSATED